MVHGDARGEIGAASVLAGLVGDDHDLPHALGRHLPRDHRHRERAVHRLPARHRHRVVVEDLVGEVDVGGDGRADREEPRVVVGAVADVGEDVLRLGERRHADPRRAFPAHLREGHRLLRAGSRSPCSGSRCRPAPRLPSGTWVEVLCGQPEQKYGHAGDLRARAGERGLLRLEELQARLHDARGHANLPMRRAITFAIIAGVSSPAAGRSHSLRCTSHSPCSSYLPITRGRSPSGQL